MSYETDISSHQYEALMKIVCFHFHHKQKREISGNCFIPQGESKYIPYYFLHNLRTSQKTPAEFEFIFTHIYSCRH